MIYDFALTSSQTVCDVASAPANFDATVVKHPWPPTRLTVIFVSGKLDLSGIKFAVIDECDTMFDDSFAPPTIHILNRFNVRAFSLPIFATGLSETPCNWPYFFRFTAASGCRYSPLTRRK